LNISWHVLVLFVFETHKKLTWSDLLFCFVLYIIIFFIVFISHFSNSWFTVFSFYFKHFLTIWLICFNNILHLQFDLNNLLVI